MGDDLPVPATGLQRLRLLRRNVGPIDNFVPSKRWLLGSSVDVLLMQGFGTGPRTVNYLAESLTDGHGLHCCVPRLGGLLGYLQTRDVRTAGQALADFIRSLPPDQKPWLIGHSIGGIIARDAVQRGGAATRVAGLVTIGSPHRGTPAAIGGLFIGLGLLSRSPWQMLPWASTVRELNALPWPEDVPMTAVVSGSDVLCPPYFGSVPFADGRNIVNKRFDGYGHTELVRSAEVASYIASLMKD
jgi:pimeloyl-ACP methyl ester carboxylesterase